MIDRVKTAMLSMARYSWEQGVCAQAFLECGDDDVVICMCYDAVNRQTEDGRLGNLGHQHAVTDPVVIVPALIKACKLTDDPVLKSALDKAIEWSLKTAPRNKDGIVYHVDNHNQFWVDSLYMFPPTLLAAGYPDEAIKQADGYINALWDTDKHLFRHIWDEDTQSFAIAEYWGVGNGWALSGLSRLIEGLPASKSAARDRYIDIVSKTIEAVLPLRDQGIFHNFLDKPDSFLEVNFAQMLAYVMIKGAKQGWLDYTYAKLAEDIRETVHKHVTPYGLVTPVCGAPYFDKPGIAPEGQAFFVLMESAF
ncbi:MAG: glycoside hydrolase family 88 protein [Defluviitaleaceae bacterium]|nr:glycoside hydrolase family 88 protein [Defluviitaleaceae bacterium]